MRSLLSDSAVDKGTQSNRSYLFWLLVILGVLLAFRVLILSVANTDLFFDEAQYWTWSTQPDFGYYSKPPLIAWLIGLSTSSCGVSEFCIRLPSALLHTATALVIYVLGWRLIDARIGFWSAVVFATLPAVSLSSAIISTDVPLLFAFALALVALVELMTSDGHARPKSWWPGLLLGLALGVGLNAKYAMAFFVLGLGVYLAITPGKRWLLRDARLYVALGIGTLMIAPNIAWNLEHSFATFSHTADNAKWGGQLLHPLKALEFFGAQFGVFGPIMFGALLVIMWRGWREGFSDDQRFLLSFSVPILLVITLQALLSRAHANWAATAYVAATILVVSVMISRREWGWLKGSIALHVGIASILGFGFWQAGKIDYPGKFDPFARTLGWRHVAAATQNVLAEAQQSGKAYAGLLTDDRSLSAELLYYMRHEKTPLRAWHIAGTRPKDHYQLTRPYRGRLDGPILLISRRKDASQITHQFAKSKLLGRQLLPAGFGKPRRVTFYALEGFQANR